MVLDGDEQREVGPSQLSQQRRDNLCAGKHLGELEHPSQILLAEAMPTAGLQLSPHRCDNLRAVFGTPAPENLGKNTTTELPVQRGERCVLGDGQLVECENAPVHARNSTRVSL